jgi:multidrug efflux pump subunit AcrA (membrane-fusion protein)
VDEQLPGEAWQEIESALDELAALARSECSPAEFHGRLLERLAGLLAAAGGIVWAIKPDAPPAVESHLHLDHCRAGDAQELSRHQKLAESVASAGQPRLVPPAFRDGRVANASPWLVLAAPVAVAGQPVLVVEIFQRPESRATVQQGYLRLVRTACDLAEEFHRTRALHFLRGRERELADLLALVEQAHQQLDLPSVAANIAGEARRILACDRVSVLAARGSRAEVVAISGAETFDRRSNVVRTLEKLARIVIASGEPLWHPDRGRELPPQMDEVLQSALDASHARGLAIVPLAVGDEPKETIGALVVEQFGAELLPAARPQIHGVAAASSLALHNALVYDKIPLRGLLLPVGKGLARVRTSRRWQVAAIAVLLAAAVAALCLIPAELTVEARGQLWPEKRQHVFAPLDGVVVELAARDGAQVEKGDVLARLHSPALDIQLSELLGRQRTAQESLQAAETELLRAEQESTNSASRAELAARIESLKVERRGLDEQLAVVRRQQDELTLASPLKGVVLTWDAKNQLESRPVKRGDALLTVADLAGPWQLALDVPDRHAGYVASARNQAGPLVVSYQIGTDPATIRRGQVERIAPATQLSESGSPILRVLARPDDPSLRPLRPGATVVARLHCGRRSLGYVWLHDLWDAIRTWLVL